MLVTYIIGSLALIVKPGPDLTCTIATALSDGKANAATLMFGLIAGCWMWVLLLTAGVASFFTAHPATMTAIQIAGAAYIAYLAYAAFADAIRSFRNSSPDALRPATARGMRLFLRGIAMSMSNPLTILFFLAFLPSFTTSSSSLSPAVQTLLLGTLFCALVPFVYLPAIVAADFFRARLVGSAHRSTWGQSPLVRKDKWRKTPNLPRKQDPLGDSPPWFGRISGGKHRICRENRANAGDGPHMITG